MAPKQFALTGCLHPEAPMVTVFYSIHSQMILQYKLQEAHLTFREYTFCDI